MGGKSIQMAWRLSAQATNPSVHLIKREQGIGGTQGVNCSRTYTLYMSLMGGGGGWSKPVLW